METLIVKISNKEQARQIRKALTLFKGVKGVSSAEEAENASLIAGIEAGIKTPYVSRNDVLNALD